MDGETIGSKAELRERYGAPSERSLQKEMTKLDAHCRHFIALSPFLVIARYDSRSFADQPHRSYFKEGGRQRGGEKGAPAQARP